MNIHSSARRVLLKRLVEVLDSAILDGVAVGWEPLLGLRGLSDTLDRGYREVAAKECVPRLEMFVIDSLEARAPFLTFVFDVLADEGSNVAAALDTLELEELEKIPKFFQTRSVPLKSPITDIRQFAEELISTYESLPWTYEYLVPLPIPAVFSSAIGPSYVLTDEIRLELLTENERRSLDSETHLRQQLEYKMLEALVELRGTDRTATLTPFVERFMLRERVKGYNLVEGADPMGSPRSTVKEFLGLAIALGVLQIHPEGDAVWGYSIPWWIAQVGEPSQTGGDGFEDLANEWIPADEAACIGALVLATDPDDTQRKRIHMIGSAFRRRELRLLNAGRWYFESFCGTNQLLQFIQATTTLEIMLGGQKSESKETGLTKLLATNCAHFLGGNRLEREQIAQQVEQLYDTRSRIVHLGKNVFEDPDDLAAMRELARRVINKELQFLVPA